MQEMRDKKATKHMENKQQNDRSKLFLMSNYLNINRLNTPIKRQRLAKRIKKNIVQLYAIYKRLTLDPKI